jgi:hypothetical protein
LKKLNGPIEEEKEIGKGMKERGGGIWVSKRI